MKFKSDRLHKKELKIEKIKRKWKIFDTEDWPKYVIIDKKHIEYKRNK